jgi:hypothetical protein
MDPKHDCAARTFRRKDPEPDMASRPCDGQVRGGELRAAIIVSGGLPEQGQALGRAYVGMRHLGEKSIHLPLRGKLARVDIRDNGVGAVELGH